MSDYPHTPELNKLSEAKEDSQKIGAFIDWLAYEPNLGPKGGIGRRAAHRAVKLKHTPVYLCRWDGEEYLPLGFSIEEILARYCDIDLEEVEKERQAVLDYLDV